jgi:hypothetical protein
VKTLVTVNNCARSKLIACPAIGATDLTGFGHIQKDAGVHAPEWGMGTGTVKGQVGGFNLNRSKGFARTTGNCVRHDYSRE